MNYKNNYLYSIENDLAESIEISNSCISNLTNKSLISSNGGTSGLFFSLLLNRLFGIDRLVSVNIGAIINLVTQQHLHTDRVIDKHYKKLKAYNVTKIDDVILNSDEARSLASYLHGNICLHAIYNHLEACDNKGLWDKKDCELFLQKMVNLMVQTDLEMFKDSIYALPTTNVGYDQKFRTHIMQGATYNMECALGVYLYNNLSITVRDTILEAFKLYGEAFGLQDDVADIDFDKSYKRTNILVYAGNNQTDKAGIKKRQNHLINMAKEKLYSALEKEKCDVLMNLMVDTITNFSYKKGVAYKYLKNAEKLALGFAHTSEVLE